MNKSNSIEQWNEVKEALRAALPEASFNTWISNLAIEKINNKELILGAANLFVKTWVENKCLQTIAEAVRTVLGSDPKVTIVISKKKFREHRQNTLHEQEHSTSTPIESSSPKHYPAKKPPLFSLSQHTFKKFVTTPQNSFALATIHQAIKFPGEYSPITIFSSHGLGKTHLLHSACNQFSENYPEKKIICLSAQMFVQQCSASYMDNKIEHFRKRFNSADLLVIEDFHFMGQGKKVASQKELATILDTLNTAKKQVIISSNKALHEIAGIKSMLASRISSGIQIRIDPLDTAAREHILSTIEPSLNTEQVKDIASRLSGDIREIEGILKTIKAMNSFTKSAGIPQNITDSLTIAQKKTNFTSGDIIAAVSLEFNIAINDIKGKKRNGDITKARRLAIHLCRHLTDISLTDIGMEFGGRRHPTILNILKTAPAEPTRLYLNKLESLIKILGADITIDEIMNSQKKIF